MTARATLLAPASAAKASLSLAGGILQRECSCGGKCGECEECRDKEEGTLQAKLNSGRSAPPSGASPPLAGSGGRPLPGGLRSRLEPSFGHDFSQVRVHDDAAGHTAAASLGARAFTMGQHIYFAAGRYRPAHEPGLRLLAHEVAHTVQQRGVTAAPPAAKAEPGGGYRVGRPSGALEREADRAADAVLSGTPAAASAGAAASIARPGGHLLIQRKAYGEAETVRATGPNQTVRIKRTLVERPCKKTAKSQSTPSDQIFYWDSDANAVGFKYRICKGKVQLGTKGAVDYNTVVRSAERLIEEIAKNPQAGQTALQNAIRTATVSANAEIRLDIDKTLTVKVSGTGSAGATQQKVQVKGELIVSPHHGVVLRVVGGIGLNQAGVQRQVKKQLRAELGLGNIKIEFHHTATTTSGVGPTKTQTQTGGTLSIPITPGISGQVTVQKGPLGGVQVLGGFGGTWEKVKKPPPVSCYDCDCPPPLPKYTCTRETAAHKKTVVDRPQRTQLFRFLHVYDDPAPQRSAEFKEKVQGVAGLVASESHVKSIRGYASPEASVKYNKALSLKRATFTRDEIAKVLAKDAPNATLPAPEGSGELLGESSKGPSEARNRDLIAELATRLKDLNDDQRLDLLGVEDKRRKDPAQRAQALADIQAFIDGRDGKRRLGRRARWEKIFPFLRRTEVEVDVHQKSHPEDVKAKKASANCSAEDVAYAVKAMPKVPARRRLPKDECTK